MRIQLVTPAPPGSRSGNRVTALRWRRQLRELGHSAQVREAFRQGDTLPDLLVALHARKSLPSIQAFLRAEPRRPLVIALTGTDVYGGLARSRSARAALSEADALIVLQEEAIRELAPRLRKRTRVFLQSAVQGPAFPTKSVRTFDVCVVGHLRPVKDPFRAALAARKLPTSSRVRILHAGAALGPRFRERAEREMARNPRYHWLGELPRWRVRRLMARSHALVLSSRAEGGANVVSEAVVSGLPVLATRIPGTTGLLGSDYPGYFEVGETRALTELLARAESDPAFLAELAAHSRSLAPTFHPRRERASWKRLLEELRTG